MLKSLEAYDLLNDVGGLPLVRLDIADVFWAVLESLNMEEAGKDEEREEVGRKGGEMAVFFFHPCSTVTIFLIFILISPPPQKVEI